MRSFEMLLPLCRLCTVCHTFNLSYLHGSTQTEIAIEEGVKCDLDCTDCEFGLRRLRVIGAKIALSGCTGWLEVAQIAT